ncbi:MAG: insulinase family protein [Clostridia bacterium]|nr:insulinase family protein [Clostridia bacterium]
MKTGTEIHGFRVTNIRRLAELNADFYEMTHEKSGARLVWLDRADANKTFSIAFKTIPEDSTGVFHILEHSVLGGSQKYPVKEPFVELLKSSVQTFLNAMTYPDKTVYPVSSRNDKDFLNLVGIYLDGVFRPSIYTKPEIFRQEGWRYEFGEDGKAIYQGVVFNEMKGVYANPDSVLDYELLKLLFPDNCYSFESGGHPEHIPDLTYEQFIAMHRKYYHPSNSLIALCGSVDTDPVLALIDSYLANYDVSPERIEIPLQGPVGCSQTEAEYEIGRDEPADSKTIVAGASVFCNYDEQEKIIAACVLADYLAGDNDSPLKRAVLENGLGEDLRVEVVDGILQPYITWQVWNTGRDKVERIKETVDCTVRSLCENGLDKEFLKASFNRFAFRLRDKDGTGAPRSLVEALTMLDTWLYGGDPAKALCVEEPLAALEANLGTGYFESLLRELFFDSPSRALVVLNPSQTLGDEKRAKEEARVAAEQASWSDAHTAELKEQQRVLTEWQKAPDSPEALATIPMLKISDLDKTPGRVSFAESKSGGITVLRTETGSALAYTNYYFNASDVPLADLPALSLLGGVLGKLATKEHDSANLQMLVKQNVGKLKFSPDVYAGKDPLHCRVFMCADVACLANRVSRANELVSEILLSTRFTDKKQLRELIKQFALSVQMSLSSRGNRFAAIRAGAYSTAHSAAQEMIAGYSYAEWLKKQSACTDEELESLAARLASLAQKLFTAERLFAGVSETVGDPEISAFAAALPHGAKCADYAEYKPLAANGDGIVIPAAIGFAAKCTNMFLHGREFSGSIYALMNILNYSYLWNEIRVQGGAYGCGFYGRPNGDLTCYSYRDPQPGRSLDIFNGAAEFVRAFCAENPDITKHIIGSVTDLDPLMNAEDKMDFAESAWIRGVTYEELCKRYTQLLNTGCGDLLDLCGLLSDIAEDNKYAVVGGKAQLDACGDKITKRLSL